MSSALEGPESQDALFASASQITPVPKKLARAVSRLEFPPSYVIVGVYRLCSDKLLYEPAWAKCQHATQRGAVVGALWALLTFSVQKKFIEVFMAHSPRVTGLSNDTMFGYKIPFNVHTYAAIILMGSQITYILRFFLARNINIARERAYAQTVLSRGKGDDFWGPYVEEFNYPPVNKVKAKQEHRGFVEKWLSGTVGRLIFRRVLLLPFNFYPGVGVLISAALKAAGTARYLHKPYFAAKKMTPLQSATFIEERKWDYRAFGFAAALLEGLPIIGLVFTISNRVGAAMWAFDLEKRQQYVAQEREAGQAFKVMQDAKME